MRKQSHVSPGSITLSCRLKFGGFSLGFLLEAFFSSASSGTLIAIMVGFREGSHVRANSS